LLLKLPYVYALISRVMGVKTIFLAFDLSTKSRQENYRISKHAKMIDLVLEKMVKKWGHIPFSSHVRNSED
jgi:hypothetical protein